MISNGQTNFSCKKNTGKTCTVKSLVIVSFLLFLDTRLDSTYMSWRNFSCLPPTTTNTDHQLLPSLYRCCKRVAGGQLATPAQNLKATTQSDQPMVTAADVVDSSDGQLFLAIDQANHITFPQMHRNSTVSHSKLSDTHHHTVSVYKSWKLKSCQTKIDTRKYQTGAT